jgi:hypothetical protein
MPATTRETLKAMAERFDISETEVVHMVPALVAEEALPAYQADDGPLTACAIKELRRNSNRALPKGSVVNKRSLF